MGHEKVVEAFGYWPLFHDAEVRSMSFDRNRILFDTISNPCVGLVVHAFEWTVAKDNSPPSFNHHIVHFEFEEVDEVRLSGFNHQNAILSIRFEPGEAAGSGVPQHRVILDPVHELAESFSYTLASSFIYTRGRIVSVVPCNDQGSPR